MQLANQKALADKYKKDADEKAKEFQANLAEQQNLLGMYEEQLMLRTEELSLIQQKNQKEEAASKFPTKG